MSNKKEICNGALLSLSNLNIENSLHLVYRKEIIFIHYQKDILIYLFVNELEFFKKDSLKSVGEQPKFFLKKRVKFDKSEK